MLGGVKNFSVGICDGASSTARSSYILYYQSSINFQFSPNFAALNIMAIHVQRHTNASKQATLLDGLDVK